jgi:hypothetical protein
MYVVPYNTAMSHLSTPQTQMIMVFYSFLTFFLGPMLTRPFLGKSPHQCVAGFLVGFTLSVLLWMKYGVKYARLYA